MDLFDQLDAQPHNLLPGDGEVLYYGPVLSRAEADDYYRVLMDEIDWRHDEVVIAGKRRVTQRKVAWYGDKAYVYGYSNTTKVALPWTPNLLKLKTLAETVSGERYNSCLLNLYHTGEEGMAWHSDAEKALKKHGAIGSFSFGAERAFAFKHKLTKEKISKVLEHGSLLIMKGSTQTHWLHRLPPTKTVHAPRVNLTFRYIEAG